MSPDVAPVYHFRDFPELFWDAQPDAVIEPDNLLVISRVLQQGSIDHVKTLVNLDVVRAHWQELWLPDHTRYVWGKVLGLPLEQ